MLDGALYEGFVVHRRVRPVAHRLRYRVFSLLVDVDRLEQLDRRLRLLSVNRANLISLHTRDHGDGSGDLRRHLDRAAGPAGTSVTRYRMLCYPRILGYAFNPLTVYYGTDADDRLRVTIYEVNNTFGERTTYTLPAEPLDDGSVRQSCAKRMHVSPFNDVTGRYTFRLTEPGQRLTVGIALRDEAGPVLNATFAAERRPLTDAALVAALARTGWMTAKVIVGIHVEAARLWMKGLKVYRRPRAQSQARPLAGDTATREGTS